MSATPANAGLFHRDPAQIPPYNRYGTAWRFYNYEYKDRFHPQYSANYFGYRREHGRHALSLAGVVNVLTTRGLPIVITLLARFHIRDSSRYLDGPSVDLICFANRSRSGSPTDVDSHRCLRGASHESRLSSACSPPDH